MKKKETLDQKFEHLKQEAKVRGLKVQKDPRLTKSPYRASHPLSCTFVDDIPTKKKAITYEPASERNKHKLVMDINHEIIEYDLAKKGVGYKKAHRIANRKQRSIFKNKYKEGG